MIGTAVFASHDLSSANDLCNTIWTQIRTDRTRGSDRQNFGPDRIQTVRNWKIFFKKYEKSQHMNNYPACNQLNSLGRGMETRPDKCCPDLDQNCGFEKKLILKKIADDKKA